MTMIRTIKKTVLSASKNHLRLNSPITNKNILGETNRCSFVSQSLLSRIDFQYKSTTELREELNKRGIVTGSKRKSILIDKILEDEQRRTMGSSKLAVSSMQRGYRSSPARKEGRKEEEQKRRLQEPVVSSPIKVAARLVDTPDAEAPASPKIHTGPKSAVVGSPAITLRSDGHRAEVWPASILLPSTPVEESMGTMIPFIPDNWTSHQQSHASPMVDLKPSSAEVSTASHPSTLPEGGPSRIVTDRFSPTHHEDLGSSSSPSPDQILSNYLAPLSKTSSFIFSNLLPTNNNKIPFHFEDRPLNQAERNGLYRLLAFFGGSWLLAGLLDRP